LIDHPDVDCVTVASTPIQAVVSVLMACGGGVYCTCADGSRHRICQAKTVRGVLVVHSLDTGHWLQPVSIDKNGRGALMTADVIGTLSRPCIMYSRRWGLLFLFLVQKSEVVKI
jgi:hypothetical protein